MPGLLDAQLCLRRQGEWPAGSLLGPQAAAALATTIVKNRDVSASYLEPLEAARAAANALERILRNSPDQITKPDLERLASIPDATVSRQGDSGGPSDATQITVDCSRVRELARRASAKERSSD